MKLWLLSQGANNNYDTYDSAVVAAETAEDAVVVHPDSTWGPRWSAANGRWEDRDGDERNHGDWTLPSNVTVELIGDAIDGTPAGKVICASFHAG